MKVEYGWFTVPKRKPTGKEAEFGLLRKIRDAYHERKRAEKEQKEVWE